MCQICHQPDIPGQHDPAPHVAFTYHYPVSVFEFADDLACVVCKTWFPCPTRKKYLDEEFWIPRLNAK